MTAAVNISGLRRVVLVVAALNLGYFCIEALVAWRIGSVSLFADSVDFLEDASVNFLIALAIDRGPRLKAAAAMLMAGIILIPGLAAGWTAILQIYQPTVPAALPLTLTGAGALAVNVTCALMLAKFRHVGGSLTRAAFLSARNDVAANVAIIAAGGVTALTLSHWPDLIVGLGILAMNAFAAREVFEAARAEWNDASEALSNAHD
jgi:Co/Zn/Cd efflux system component